MQCAGGVRKNAGVITENPHKESRHAVDKEPGGKGVREGQKEHDADGFFDILGPFCTVIKADDGRGAFRNRLNGNIQNRTHRGDNGHDGHIHGSAVLHQHTVAGNLYERIGELHDKRRQTEADDIASIRETPGKLNAELIFRSEQKAQYETKR